MKNHQKDTCCPGDGLHKFRQLPDMIILWHEIGHRTSQEAQWQESEIALHRGSG